MRNANRKGMRLIAAAVATGAFAVAGVTLATSWETVASAAPATPAAAHMNDMPGTPTPSPTGTAGPGHKTTLHLNLAPMPQGTVSIGDGVVRLSAWGLTPGSQHVVDVLSHGKLTRLGPLTANATGDVAGVSYGARHIPAGSRVVILDGAANTSVIAETNGASRGQHSLHAVEAGFPEGSLRGQATLVYDPVAHTVTVTVTASGLTPGAHAAHIHVGSCESQGPVQYMLMDFTASAHGNIDHETRVVTGVTTSPLAAGWYLNLHQGNSNNILSNGQPTIFFRPLLCANL